MEKYRVEYHPEGKYSLVIGPDFCWKCDDLEIAGKLWKHLNSLSTRIEELDEQITVFSGLEDGSCPELIEWFENNLCNVENPSDDVTDTYWPMLCHLEDSHIRLTAELKASNRRFEGLEYSGNPRDWMLHLTAEVETQKAENSKLKGQVKELEDAEGAAIGPMQDSIDALTGKVETQKAEIERLRGTLGFYADFKQYTHQDVARMDEKPRFDYRILNDGGSMARQVLTPASPQGEETKEESDEG